MSQHDAVEPSTPSTSTGLAEVDEALGRLAEIAERPVAEHPEALAAVHEVLHQSLQSPAGPSPVPSPAGRTGH